MKRKRGTCPVCHRDVALLFDGRVGRHGDKFSWPPKDCRGYGAPADSSNKETL